MTKILFILILSFSVTCFAQDKLTIPSESLRNFYNKTIINTLTDSADRKQCEKYGFILIQTDFDTTALVKKVGDIKFRYFSSEVPLQSILDKPYKKHIDQTIYIVNHFLINQDTVDVNIGRQVIAQVDKKNAMIRAECGGTMGYIPTGRFINSRVSNSWTFTPDSVFLNRAFEAMKKKLNKN